MEWPPSKVHKSGPKLRSFRLVKLFQGCLTDLKYFLDDKRNAEHTERKTASVTPSVLRYPSKDLFAYGIMALVLDVSRPQDTD